MLIHAPFEKDLIKTGWVIHFRKGPFKVDGRGRRRIGNAVVDLAAQFGLDDFALISVGPKLKSNWQYWNI